MIIETSVYKEIFGPLRIHEVQKVLKLDSETEEVTNTFVINVPREEIYSILSDLAIVVPLKDELLITLDGVLKAIPHKCPIIVVSNSKKEGPNNFRQEVELIKHFYNLTNSRIILIHQKDRGLSAAFKDVGYTHLLDEEEYVRNGKGEGMLVGLMLAKAIGAKYVGFVDADNYVPGSVNEYVKDYAAGFIISESPFTMVRLHWRHKPKIERRRLYFKKWGRVSEVTNKFLNLFMGYLTRFETNIIVTGNAGEHAMSIELADLMAFSTGYSIEPYQYIYLLEYFGTGKASEEHPDVYHHGIDILQLETLNPHFHEEKGKEHLADMLLCSLATIYTSKLATAELKKQILEELKERKIIQNESEIKKPLVMPPVKDIDVERWKRVLLDNTETLLVFDRGESTLS